MTTWFTSDEHYGHGKIIEHSGRPFADLSHMREELIRRHNMLVCPTDIVWHLGDFSFARPAESMAILARLNGEHHLVLGNHDRSATAMLSIGFRSVQYSKRLEIDGHRLVLRHLPPAHAPTDDRQFASKFYAPVDGVDFVLCGHVHEKWAQVGNVFNVGVDVRVFAPITLQALLNNTSVPR